MATDLILVVPALRPLLMAGVLITLLIAPIFASQLRPFANIAAGALLALTPGLRHLIQRLSSPLAVWSAIGFLLLRPLIPRTGAVAPLFVAFVFAATIEKDRPMHWILLSYPIQKLGLISYSAYLWQQTSTAPFVWGGHNTGADAFYSAYPMAAWLFLAPATFSYFLIEAPSQRVGRQLSSWIKSAPPSPATSDRGR